MSRKLDLEELICVLCKEHEEVRRQMIELKEAIAESGEKAREIASTLDKSLIQHMLDEESRLLRILIQAYGRKGADEAVRVMQQHRPIHDLLESIAKLAMTDPEGLHMKRDELGALFNQHFNSEEKRIFPWTLETSKHADTRQS